MINILRITLKAARVNRGMTQKELADKVGRSPYSIINWENGNTPIPLYDFKKICKVLKIPEDNVLLPIKSS